MSKQSRQRQAQKKRRTEEKRKAARRGQHQARAAFSSMPQAQIPKHMAVVKVSGPALATPDYQLIPLYDGDTLDQLREQTITHLLEHYTADQFQVDVWDADHVPSGAVPPDLELSTGPMIIDADWS